MKLTKYCRCGKQIPHKVRCCEECTPYYNKQDAKYHKKYDTTKRINAEFYESQEWKDLRAIIIAKTNGIDLYDYYINNKITKATTVHHIIELREDYSKRLDIENLIPLSGANHSRIHKLYFRNKKKTQEMLYEILKNAKRDGLR